jgi:hypothetical protein
VTASCAADFRIVLRDKPFAHQAKGHADDLIAGMAKAGEETDRRMPCAAIASAFRLTDVPTDADRFRFIAKFRLHVSFSR